MASTREIDDLVGYQLGSWQKASFDASALPNALRSLNESLPSIFIFEVKKKIVSAVSKPFVHGRSDLKPASAAQIEPFSVRKELYRRYLQMVVVRSAIDIDFKLAIDVNDGCAEGYEAPIFAFQKNRDSRNLLLPDPDFFHWNWYSDLEDTTCYEDKKMKACFVGSSTGGPVSAQSIVGLTLPRFRAAAYFVDSPIVDFRIANAIQYDTTETRELLQRQPYFSETMGWQEQFSYRFLISIDGNGAACSRLVIGLKSNSAVIKYRSPYSLFYFPIMAAGRDYIEVAEDRDVELVVQQELARPGHFKAVADAGKNFASRILNQNSVGDYTGALIGGYAKMFFG